MAGRTPVLAAVLAALAGAAFHRVIPLGSLAVPVAIAAAAPTALAGLAGTIAARWAGRSLPLAVPLAVSLAALLPVGALLLAGDLSWAAITEVATGVRSGWRFLLGTTLPARPEPVVLAVPFTVSWLAATLAVELNRRTRGILLPALPAAAGFAATLPLTAAGTGPAVPVALAFGTCCAAFTISRRLDLDRAGGRGPATGLAALAAVTLGAAALAGPATGLVHRDRLDARDHLSLPEAALTGINPLDRVPAWLSEPDTGLFEVRASAALPGRLRLVNLDAFDGHTWTSTSHYLTVGLSVPGPPAGTLVRTPAVHVEVRVGALAGVALPVLDRPIRVDAAGAARTLAVDPVGGLLVATVAVRPGYTYRMDSVPPAADDVPLDSGRPGAGPVADAARGLPAGLPAPVLALVRDIAAEDPRPGARARLLAQRLRARLANQPASPPGHSYGRLAAALVDGAGSAEQNAALFAVAARALGLPSRVVVGFTPQPSAPGATTYRVRSGDVAVWPEVLFDGAGWVAFDPLPRPAPLVRQRSLPLAAPAQPPPRDTAAPSSDASEPPAGGGVRAAAGTLQGRGPRLWPVSVALLLVLVAGWLLGRPVRRRVRRHRRRTRGDPAARVSGALHDLLDSIAATGRPVPPDATQREVLHHLAGLAGQPGRRGMPMLSALRETDELVRLVDRALYAEPRPTDEDAATAWRHCDRIRGLIGESHPRRLFAARRPTDHR